MRPNPDFFKTKLIDLTNILTVNVDILWKIVI